MSASLEAISAPEVQRRLSRVTGIVFVVVVVLTAGTLLAVVLRGLPWPAAFVFPLLFVLVLVLRYPPVGLYILFASALLIPVQPLGYSDSITDNVPFFLNLSDPGSLNLSGLGITPAEILMVTIFAGLIAVVSATHKRLTAGRLMVPYLIFGLVVLVGELNGLVHGGDFKLSLWELRPQAYGLAVFVMATRLVQNRTQLKVLLVILLVAEAFKGSVGVFRYFVTLGRDVGSAEAIQAHEESYLLGLFLVIIVIGLIWFRRPLIVLLVAVAPIVVTAIVVNHRRAGTGALGLEIVTVLVLAYIAEPRLRRQLLIAGAVIAMLGIAFVVTFWNQQSGSIAEVIRPIKSLVDPNARDLSSDLYRIAESANLKATFRTAPLFGIGFGHPYYIFYPQNGVAQYDPLWNIIPHNTILWIPMRMGIVGVVSFWCLISTAIVEAIWAIRTIKDKFIRAAVVFALAAIFGVLFTGYFDIGIENYRDLIVLGVLLAVINQAGHLARDDQALDGHVAIVENRAVIGASPAVTARVPVGAARSGPADEARGPRT